MIVFHESRDSHKYSQLAESFSPDSETEENQLIAVVACVASVSVGFGSRLIAVDKKRTILGINYFRGSSRVNGNVREKSYFLLLWGKNRWCAKLFR